MTIDRTTCPMCSKGKPLPDSLAGLCLKCATAVHESVIRQALDRMGVKANG